MVGTGKVGYTLPPSLVGKLPSLTIIWNCLSLFFERDYLFVGMQLHITDKDIPISIYTLDLSCLLGEIFFSFILIQPFLLIQFAAEKLLKINIAD